MELHYQVFALTGSHGTIEAKAPAGEGWEAQPPHPYQGGVLFIWCRPAPVQKPKRKPKK